MFLSKLLKYMFMELNSSWLTTLIILILEPGSRKSNLANNNNSEIFAWHDSRQSRTSLQNDLLLVPAKLSLPNDLSEFRESEPIGICENINSIHDQGRGYLYLEDRRSKRGFPPTLRKTTWIFNFYCNAVFLKAIHLHLVWRFQNGITLEYWTSGSGRNKLLSSSKPRPTSLKRTFWYLTPKC